MQEREREAEIYHGGHCHSCWWEKPLVVALKHSEGIKHTVLFQEQKAYNNLKSLQYTPSLSLFFSSVSLYSLHTK